VSCGKGGDYGGSLYVDYFCCDNKQVTATALYSQESLQCTNYWISSYAVWHHAASSSSDSNWVLAVTARLLWAQHTLQLLRDRKVHCAAWWCCCLTSHCAHCYHALHTHALQLCIFDGGLGGGWTRCISNFFCTATTCNGHGTCVDEPIYRNANIDKAFLNCTCNAGYSGRFCETGP
jgi:hypothetical protein